MTCIAAVKDGSRIWMGGDSLSNGATPELTVAPKVFRCGAFLIGFAGECRDRMVIQHAFKPPAIPQKQSIDAYLATTFTAALRVCLKEHGRLERENEVDGNNCALLIAHKGELWSMDSYFATIWLRSQYGAIGSGASVALGALHATPELSARVRLLRALRAAERYSTTVRGPFVIKKL